MLGVGLVPLVRRGGLLWRSICRLICVLLLVSYCLCAGGCGVPVAVVGLCWGRVWLTPVEVHIGWWHLVFYVRCLVAAPWTVSCGTLGWSSTVRRCGSCCLRLVWCWCYRSRRHSGRLGCHRGIVKCGWGHLRTCCRPTHWLLIQKGGHDGAIVWVLVVFVRVHMLSRGPLVAVVGMLHRDRVPTRVVVDQNGLLYVVPG